ncbi:insulinase family protein [Oenococcus sp. UCMA 16435]|nr:insulinase family protein [Oenococcus sp. UCMA 16435]MDN6967688.1 insulinase family protein [Oenococcus sp. UCMA 17063]
MKTENFQSYKQHVYSETLSDGLKITLIPKKGFRSVFAALFVNVGASDQRIVDENGETVTFPSGTAHFAEHKMFEKKAGDVSELFSTYGAFSNAYTSQSQTVYYFQGTDNIDQSIKLLLQFVQKPYYTQASVAKEQGIIGQEISMYQDMPDWVSSFGLMKNLYRKQPLGKDIAGNIQTIGQIDADLLYKFHRYFYQPNNLQLKITGNIDPKRILDLLKQTQNHLTRPKVNYSRVSLFDTKIPVEKKADQDMPIALPLLTAGIKGNKDIPDLDTAIDLSFSSDLILDIYFSDSSDWYLKNYNRGLLNDDFSAQAEVSRNYNFISFTGHSENKELLKQIYFQLKNVSYNQELEQEFQIQKRASLGELSMSLDQLENNVFTIADGFDNDVNIFQVIEKLQDLTYQKAVNLFKRYYDIDSFSTFCVNPVE